MENLHVSTHPLAIHKLTQLRSVDTDHRSFRELVRELALLMCYEATRDLDLTPRTVETPLGLAAGQSCHDTIGLRPGTARRAGSG